MPYLIKYKPKEHDCPLQKLVIEKIGNGSVWECPRCLQQWILLDYVWTRIPEDKFIESDHNPDRKLSLRYRSVG